MFTQSCFIRKNTPELKGKLKEFGYDLNELHPNSECIATSNVNSKAVGISEDRFDDNNPHRTWNCNGRIDCGTNEDLFLALAALRDDSDYMQYFIAAESDKPMLCTKENIEDHTVWHELYRKMTAEELFDYFNKQNV